MISTLGVDANSLCELNQLPQITSPMAVVACFLLLMMMCFAVISRVIELQTDEKSNKSKFIDNWRTN